MKYFYICLIGMLIISILFLIFGAISIDRSDEYMDDSFRWGERDKD